LDSPWFFIALAGVAMAAIIMVGFGLRRKSGSSAAQRALNEAKAQRVVEARSKGRALLDKGKLDEAFNVVSKFPLDPEAAKMLEEIALGYQAAGNGKQADKVALYLARKNKAYRNFVKKMPGANTVLEMNAPPARAAPPPKGQWAQVAPGTPSMHEATVQMVARPDLLPPEKPRLQKVSTLGPYKLKQLLAETNHGMIYLGVDEKTGIEAVVKAFPVTQGQRGAERQQALTEFAQEAKSLAAINHPNIARLLRAGQAEGVAFVAMEKLPGVSLADHCEASRLLKPAEVASITVRLADALHQAHERSLIHGDIKPASVYYEPATSGIKLVDFGLARIATAVETAAGVIHGTPAYMSPEQISGRKIDGRSDLFSLAVSMYQLLCGKLPFEGTDFNDLMYRLVSASHPDIRSFNPALPSDLSAFFDRALAKNPKQRFQTGHEFATAARAAMAWAG
jgi:serine/threonine-protein kinase